jgi:hypothetical protein
MEDFIGVDNEATVVKELTWNDTVRNFDRKKWGIW